MEEKKNEENNLGNYIPEINTKGGNIKYPVAGTAPNLIDKFLVCAYEQKTIDYTFETQEDIEPDINYKTLFRFFDFPERPSIINEICNDYEKDLLDNDLILELVFPNFPRMYFLDKQNINSKKDPEDELLISNYSIIFSINPQDNNGSKKSYNGLGYVFYIPQEHKIMNGVDGIIYIPITYIILSEYPYFYHFNEICKNIFIQMKKETDEMPIDIILYNIIKYCPSPINKNINFSFGAQLNINMNEKMTINNITKILNSLPNKREEINGIPSMFFNQLSGYPFLDINLSFIFNLIPPEIICEVFIFSFLEQDIIFYSERPEILNMIIYIFSNLNYPFNDSIYYWHLLSVSKENFMSGTSTFVGKTCSTLIGILGQYDPDLLTTKKITEHFVLDIDNKNFFFLFQEETEEVKEIMDLFMYIKSCAVQEEETPGEPGKPEKNDKKNIYSDGMQLYEIIHELMEELVRRAKKVTSVNYNNRPVKPTFLTRYDDESEIECMKANIRIQKAFFNFITRIIKQFMGNLDVGLIEEEIEIDDNEGVRDKRIPSLMINLKKKSDAKADNKNDEEEEKKRKLAERAGKIFKERFKDCSKYSSFIINFCQYHDTIDLYKIPYTFINEFIYYSHITGNNLGEVDVFKLIDQFYGKEKTINFEDFIKEKNNKKNKKKNGNIQNDEIDMRNIYYFSFDKFGNFYKDELLKNINREQEDDRDIFVKVKGGSKNYKKYKRNGYFLSNKILSYYINFSNNKEDKLKDIFKLYQCKYILDKNEDIHFQENLKNLSKEGKFWSEFEVVEKKSEHEIVLNNANKLLKSQIIEENNLIEENENKECLDYYLIESKDKEEKNLKFFGSYNFMEITDVIERHFILERCFSSYDLIKFSLFNILAITREIKEQKLDNVKIIQIICDFCQKTKSSVRKYMNIFLRIFQALKAKKVLKKEECNSCSKIITNFFQQTNIIPTEETTLTINEIMNSNRNSSIHRQSVVSSINSESEDKIHKNELEEVETKGQFFDIKKKKKYEAALKEIETIFSGKYEINDKKDKKDKKKKKEDETESSINFGYSDLDGLYNELLGNKNKPNSFVPETPLSLYASTNNLWNKYLNVFSFDKLVNIEVGRDILSLLYYFKIPIIGRKWIEGYKDESNKEIKDKKEYKDKKEKNKENEKDKEEEKKKEENEIKNLNEVIKTIIFILEDLFKIIKSK